MDFNSVKNFWFKVVGHINRYGIPLPMIRDPKTGKGSISLTFTFISFNIVVFGLMGKAAGLLGGVDLVQAMNLFYACAALYWGRKFQQPNSSERETPQKEEKRSYRVDDPDA